MKTYSFKSPFGGDTYSVTVRRGKYSNGQNSLELIDAKDGSPYAIASVSIPQKLQAPDEVYIKDWSENEGVLSFLLKNGIVHEPHADIPTGFVSASVCRFKI